MHKVYWDFNIFKLILKREILILSSERFSWQKHISVIIILIYIVIIISHLPVFDQYIKLQIIVYEIMKRLQWNIKNDMKQTV